jgi:hypothetical protein
MRIETNAQSIHEESKEREGVFRTSQANRVARIIALRPSRRQESVSRKHSQRITEIDSRLDNIELLLQEQSKDIEEIKKRCKR